MRIKFWINGVYQFSITIFLSCMLLRQNPFHIYVPGTVSIRILVNKVSYVMLNWNIIFVPSYEHMLLVTIRIWNNVDLVRCRYMCLEFLWKFVEVDGWQFEVIMRRKLVMHKLVKLRWFLQVQKSHFPLVIYEKWVLRIWMQWKVWKCANIFRSIFPWILWNTKSSIRCNNEENI